MSDANLSNANLSSTNLIYTDLYHANLSEANLSGANLSDAELMEADLSMTQALGTNFFTALLTGACVEDWQINSETQLSSVECEYIYLKNEQQERRPSSGEFAPGEFIQLFQEDLENNN